MICKVSGRFDFNGHQLFFIEPGTPDALCLCDTPVLKAGPVALGIETFVFPERSFVRRYSVCFQAVQFVLAGQIYPRENLTGKSLA